MSVDLQVVFPQQIIPLTGVRFLSGFAPSTLDILGDDFTSLSQVRINDLVSPDVVIVSASRILAQVPDGLQGATVTSVVATSTQLALTAKSLLQFQLGTVTQKVSGILRLLQRFLKILFTTPGTDIFNRTLGGGALGIVGNTFSQDQSTFIVSSLVIAVNTTQRQLLSLDSRNTNSPRSERLLAARVLQANYNRPEASLDVAIEVTSQAGRSATANLNI